MPISDAAGIREALDAMFDMPLIRHGFTDYNRDYEVVWQIPTNAAGPDAGCIYTYRFRACVEAHYDGSFHQSMFPLNDDFIDYERWEVAGEPSGFVWGVKWADHYPGSSYVHDSARAVAYSAELGVPIHDLGEDRYIPSVARLPRSRHRAQRGDRPSSASLMHGPTFHRGHVDPLSPAGRMAVRYWLVPPWSTLDGFPFHVRR